MTSLNRSTIVLRRPLGRKNTVERDALDVGKSRLRHGRHVGQRRHALLAGNRQRAQLAGLQMLERIDELLESDVDMAGDQIVDRRRVAAVVHLGPSDAGLELEQLAEEVIDAGDAAGRERELAGIFVRVIDQFLDRCDRQRGPHQQHVGGEGERAHRGEGLLPLVGGFRHGERSEDDRPIRPDQQRMPIGLGARHVVAGDQAGAAGPVLDDDRLAERVADRRLQHARAHVDIAARRVGHDHGDRLRWELLRGGRQRPGGKQTETQKPAQWTHDRSSPARVPAHTRPWRIGANRSAATERGARSARQ